MLLFSSSHFSVCLSLPLSAISLVTAYKHMRLFWNYLNLYYIAHKKHLIWHIKCFFPSTLPYHFNVWGNTDPHLNTDMLPHSWYQPAWPTSIHLLEWDTELHVASEDKEHHWGDVVLLANGCQCQVSIWRASEHAAACDVWWGQCLCSVSSIFFLAPFPWGSFRHIWR